MPIRGSIRCCKMTKDQKHSKELDVHGDSDDDHDR